MKFGQFIKHKMRNIFVEKSYVKCGGETIPRLFSTKSKLSLNPVNSVKFYTVLFLLYDKFLYIYIITFTRLNVNNFQSPGNLN